MDESLLVTSQLVGSSNELQIALYTLLRIGNTLQRIGWMNTEQPAHHYIVE